MDSKSVGRFAPSPTGPLHFGSIVAAVASFLDAKSAGGKWLVRIEDVDEARTVPGAAEHMLKLLENLGMEWDGEVLYQSGRKRLYQEAMAALGAFAYPCSCSRREIEGIYKGTCRSGAKGEAKSVRVRVNDEKISFIDLIQGEYAQNLENEVGDFVLFRADGFFAYQLAVVVDDWEQGVTRIVRGADLLDSTPRQIHLQKLLGFDIPIYAHLPVAVNDQGEKLSKQTQAEAAAPEIQTLFKALSFLGQNPPKLLLEGDIPAFWNWALQNWDIDRVPKTKSIMEKT
jgi:glutamyl-Q tRNA(Asp) synthetase